MTLDEFVRIAAPTLQALSIAVTAVFAIIGLNAWRRQLVGKRRIETAEETLLAAYKVRDAFTYFRSPGRPFAGEGSTRPGRGENESEGLASIKDSYFVPIERLQDARIVEAFAQLSKAALLSETYFGTATAKPFQDILQARNRVVVAAQMLLRTAGDESVNPKLRERWEAEIWAGKPEEDEIAATVEKSIYEIEAMCRPLLAVDGKSLWQRTWRTAAAACCIVTRKRRNR